MDVYLVVLGTCRNLYSYLVYFFVVAALITCVCLSQYSYTRGLLVATGRKLVLRLRTTGLLETLRPCNGGWSSVSAHILPLFTFACDVPQHGTMSTIVSEFFGFLTIPPNSNRKLSSPTNRTGRSLVAPSPYSST